MHTTADLLPVGGGIRRLVTIVTSERFWKGPTVPECCVAYGCNLTVEHIPIECEDFAEVRQKYYDAGVIPRNQFYICIVDLYLHSMRTGI